MIDGTKPNHEIVSKIIPQIWIVKVNRRKLTSVCQSTEAGPILAFGCHVQDLVEKELIDVIDFAIIQFLLLEVINVKEIILRRTNATLTVQ